MNDFESRYFSRQHALDAEGLARLRGCTVAVAGVGHVGGPFAAEVARAGIGHLVLIDNGYVEEENCSRGIFSRRQVGMTKVAAAKAWLARNAPYTRITTLPGDLRTEIPEGVFRECHGVMIATDNWSSRLWVNRWAHALPGRTRVIASGGLYRLSWDLIVAMPGSGLGCPQCPLGAEAATADEGGGCGVIGESVDGGPDPSVSYAGATVAMMAVAEVVHTLATGSSRMPGQMLSFDADRFSFDLRTIIPDPNCTAHRRLDNDAHVIVPAADCTVSKMATLVATELGVAAERVALASERELLRTRHCRSCGLATEIRRPVLTCRQEAAAPCAACSAATFEYETHTVLDEPHLLLSAAGLPAGKALVALVEGRRVTVVRADRREPS